MDMMAMANRLAPEELIVSIKSFLFAEYTRSRQTMFRSFDHLKKNNMFISFVVPLLEADSLPSACCTRQSLCRVQRSAKSLRVLNFGHSVKALPSAVRALGKDLMPSADGRRRLIFFKLFAECHNFGTRQRNLFF